MGAKKHLVYPSNPEMPVKGVNDGTGGRLDLLIGLEILIIEKVGDNQLRWITNPLINIASDCKSSLREVICVKYSFLLAD